MIPANAKPGDFVLAHIDGDVGKLIQFGQWLNGDGFGDYEHAFVYLGQSMCVEAEPGGARIGNADGYAKTYWSSGIIDLTSDQRFQIVQAAHKYVGTPYSAADYFALAARRLHIPAPGLKAYVASSGHMICSQLVAKCYADAGFPLYDEWTGYVTPGDLWQLLESKKALWR
jgi:cell wall-associated NlpC family hydrolase